MGNMYDLCRAFIKTGIIVVLMVTSGLGDIYIMGDLVDIICSLFIV